MGREVRKINRESAEWHVVNIGDNASDPKPFRVLLAPLSGADMLKVRSASMGVELKKKGANVNDAVQALRERIFAEHVVGVEEYAISDDAGKRSVPIDGHELLAAIKQAGASELLIIDDVFDHLTESSALEGEAEKKSEPQPATLAPMSRAGNGSAPSAPTTTRILPPLKLEMPTEANAGVTTTEPSRTASAGRHG